jgi:dihydrolipoamide dehydrogenase
MQNYDVIVIGSGAGLNIVEKALIKGQKTAIIDKGPLGGTCLNVGCIPTKMLIYPADVIHEILNSKRLGITAEITNIDFQLIMNRMQNVIKKNQKDIKKWIRDSKELDYYEGEGHFIDKNTIKIKNKKITGKNIIIATGARPLIPDIKGIEKCDYLTNENVLKLKKKPDSIIIIGGGYIGVEFAHFFASIGVKVTILQRPDRIIKEEEPEISNLLKKHLEKKMSIYVNTEAIEVKKKGKSHIIIAKNIETGKIIRFSADKIMIAVGRKSNADLLKIENTSIKLDDDGYIKVDKYFQTHEQNIWSFGDAIGKYMYRHAANAESEIVWNNIFNLKKVKMDFNTIPHAIFSNPQIASIGLTEDKARKKYDIIIGKANYSDVAMGWAMMEKNGFAKAIIDKKTKKLLGFHIIGPNASILIQEVVNIMSTNGNISSLKNSIHIHPALSELIQSITYNIKS